MLDAFQIMTAILEGDSISHYFTFKTGSDMLSNFSKARGRFWGQIQI